MKAYRILRGAIALLVLFLLAQSFTLSARAEQGDYSRDQLSQMLAPIALYPDDLLSQVLMASTYPLEVVEADRWVKQNPMLTGANLDEALKDKDWDTSVKALCHVPTVLALMSDRLEETTDLGNAFLAQESDVMAAIQDLRRSAYDEGNLVSNDKQKVVFRSDGTIVIEPADPQIVYVPYYDTNYVYGSWLYPDYPPWYWGPPGVVVGPGIYFWPDFYVGFSLGFGYWCNFDWPRRILVFNVRRRPAFFRRNYDWDSHRGTWHHEPYHRRGVAYRDRITAQRFGQYPKSGQVFEGGRWRFPEQRSGNRLNREIPGGVVRSPATAGSPRVNESVARGRTSAGRGRVTTFPERREEEAWRREQPGRQEHTTVFGGIENGREERRSSIRGGASRGAMRWHGQEGQHGAPSSSQQHGGRGGGGRGLQR